MISGRRFAIATHNHSSHGLQLVISMSERYVSDARNTWKTVRDSILNSLPLQSENSSLFFSNCKSLATDEVCIVGSLIVLRLYINKLIIGVWSMKSNLDNDDNHCWRTEWQLSGSDFQLYTSALDLPQVARVARFFVSIFSHLNRSPPKR